MTFCATRWEQLAPLVERAAMVLLVGHQGVLRSIRLNADGSARVRFAGEFLPPRPWRLEPLNGKFYGTSIVDAAGKTVCDIWLCAGPPSPREDMDPEDVCDSHYESMADYQTATLICDLVNASYSGGGTDQ